MIDHFVLSNPFRYDPNETRRFFEPEREEAAKRGLVPVLSHEDLCGYPVYGRYYGKDVADRLHAALPDARVLIGIREQRSTLISHYRQYVRQGEPATIEEFLGPKSPTPGFAPICRLDHFEYDLLVGHYRALFGPDRVLVLPLERLRKDMPGYLDAIRAFVGIETNILPREQPRNVGWGGVTLAMLRRFNSYNIGLADWSRPRQSLSHRAVKRLCRLTDAAVPTSMHKKAERQMRSIIDDRCQGYFEASNQRLSDMLGISLKDYGYAV